MPNPRTNKLSSAADLKLAAEMADYFDDPLGFVLDCFPWGEGDLAEKDPGPDVNQIEFLTSLGNEVKQRNFNPETLEPVMPVRMSESSGHGTGKSAMGAWLTWWILSTRPKSIGTITAGSYTQLEEKTWAAIKKWGKLCPTYHWFEVMATGIYAKSDPEEWKVTCQTCKEENSQNFAGQHLRNGTSWYLFDEASEVPGKIWETASGGLTDGEPMWFAWGQMVRNTGEFYEKCFGRDSTTWNTRKVDGWTSKFTNKPYLQELLDKYGEASDYYRVRVLGLPPSASELQYIDRNRVSEARQRVIHPFPEDPLIAGFDVSGGGRAWNVIRFRRGMSMRVKEPIRIPGEADPDRGQRVALCAELLSDERPNHRISAMFVDAAFGSPIVQHLRLLGYKNVFEVNFGSESPDSTHFLNARSYMYGQLKEWLLTGSIPDDDDLAAQLCLPGYHFRTGTSKLVLESKQDIQKRGEKSPDDADACALTFARKIPLNVTPKKEHAGFGHRHFGADQWMK